MTKKIKIILVVFFIVLVGESFSQPKSNLEIIYNLVDKNVDKLLTKLPHEINPFQFHYNSPEAFKSLENKYILNLSSKGYLKTDSTGKTLVSFSLDEIGIEYSEPFRDGLLGDYLVKRKILDKGTFVYTINESVKKSDIIESSYSDTLYYSDLNLVENANLKFTQGTKPSEPLFESLLEPVIAIGAVIVTIILLFTVRSK